MYRLVSIGQATLWKRRVAECSLPDSDCFEDLKSSPIVVPAFSAEMDTEFFGDVHSYLMMVPESACRCQRTYSTQKISH